MAGISWIKIETTLPDKPVVLTLRRLLKRNKSEVVGMLVRLLCWADGVTEDGVLHGLTVEDIDIVVDCDGFGAALVEAGWLVDGEVLSFNGWGTHNGESAKKRANHARNVEKSRMKSRCDLDVTEENHEMVTSESQASHLDKIREDKNIARSTRACARDFVTSGEDGEAAPPAPPAPKKKTASKGAAELCAAWPKRAFLNEKIRAVYASCIADGIKHEELMECLRMAKGCKQWEEQDGRFIPTVDKWLHERRFAPDLERVRAAKRQRDEKKRAEQTEAEINALIYGDYDDEEAEQDV